MVLPGEEVLKEKRIELDGLCADPAAEDPGGERARDAGLWALSCAKECWKDGTAEAYPGMLGEAPSSLAVHRYVALELIDIERRSCARST